MKKKLLLLLLVSAYTATSQYKKEHYDDGTIESEGMYLNGKKDGEWKYYHEYGADPLKEVGNYKKGFRDGEWKTYSKDKNGNYSYLFSSVEYKKDKENGAYKFFGPNEQIMGLFTMVDGKQTGLTEMYYATGQLKGKGTLLDGKQNGEAIEYYENGQVYQTIIWENGLPKTVVSCFNTEGKELDKGTLRNGNGSVNYYTDDGTLKETKNYENGKLIKD